MKSRQIHRGMFIVEFAIVASVLFVVLLAAIELSRMIWIWNTVDEATRRGARLAAVCEIGHSDIPEATIFASSGETTSPILRGLEKCNVCVEYLNVDGTVLGTPAFEDVRYVRVSINSNSPSCQTCPKYDVDPIIPFVPGTYTLPTFETTLPSESLGYIPDSDPPQFGCL